MESSHKIQSEWRFETLPKATKNALDFLAKQKWLKGTRWYLAGGTALALYEGHRVSLGLDFFTPRKTFYSKDVLVELDDKDWKVYVAEAGTIYASFHSAKVSFIAYPFFIPKEKMAQYGNVKVLQPRDIAVMKIIAISQRGRKRDFVDLYWYVKNYESLSNIVARLPEQYPIVAHDYHHILKSLMYFQDAEIDLMPKLFFEADWKDIKRYFQREVPRVAKEFLGIK